MHVVHRSDVLCLLLTLLGFVLTLHRTGNDFINLTGNSDFVLVNMSEELSRSHAACRGWVTRECKNLATTLEDPELNVVKLSAAMDEFDKRLTNLDDVQSRYELSLEDEDAILNDITTAADFRDSAKKVRTLATEKFKEHSEDSENKSAAYVSSFSITDVKLPKLNLPVFNGDMLQWQSFWEQFVAAVDSTDLPDVSKFSYLRASLEGETNQLYRVCLSQVLTMQQRVKYSKTDLATKILLFSYIFRSCLICLCLLNAQCLLFGNWMIIYRHTPVLWQLSGLMVTWWQGAWKWPQVFAIFSWKRNSKERKVTNVSGVFGAKF